MRTYSAKPGEITREWYLVDAEGQTLGRLATQIADRLRGKGKPTYTPHVDTGDFVVVVNAEKIAVTGKKLDELQSVVEVWADSALCLSESDLKLMRRLVDAQARLVAA